VAAEEAGCSKLHKEAVVSASFEDTQRTLVVSGRPLRVKTNGYIREWEKRPEEIRKLCEQGIVPMMRDLDEDKEVDMPYLMGQVAGVIKDIKPAREIVEEMVRECVEVFRGQQRYIVEEGGRSKL
jgi:NAD(P)H-dependent flavin oxidoreductase YrpB (nitropropane dioxygenase family)